MVGTALKNIDRSSPWPTFDDWTRDFDQIFGEMDRMLAPMRTPQTKHGALCDVHETDAGYLLSVELPGVAKEDIHIENNGKMITITAERKRNKAYQDAETHRTERSYGLIKRSFGLPEGVDTDQIQANYEDGVLYLSLPKGEAAKPKKIEINSGKSGFLRNLISKGEDEK